MKMSIPAKPTLLGPAQRLQHKATSKKDAHHPIPTSPQGFPIEIWGLQFVRPTFWNVNQSTTVNFEKQHWDHWGERFIPCLTKQKPCYEQYEMIIKPALDHLLPWLTLRLPLRDWGSQTTAKHCVATRARWRLLDFHLWSATSLAHVCLGSIWMDGCAGAGASKFPIGNS